MNHELETTKNFAPTMAEEIRKKVFLNPPMGNMPITKENGWETIGSLDWFHQSPNGWFSVVHT